MDEINYEDLIVLEIKKILSKKYNILNNNILYVYLYIRYMIHNFNRRFKISDVEVSDEFIDFIIKEMGIELSNNSIIFNGIKLSKYIGVSNNIKNCINEWNNEVLNSDLEFILNRNVSLNEYILQEYKHILKKGRYRSKEYKNAYFYENLLLNNMLNLLNDRFYIDSINEATMSDLFDYDENYYLNCIPSEISCNRFLHSVNYIYDMTEKELEDYLVNHIDIIEKDLVYIDRQVKIDGGVLDIIAKDKNNNYVVIELKTNNRDKRLVWQSIHYKTEIDKWFNKEGVRVITIAPGYTNSNLEYLKALDYVDIYVYDILNKENIKIKEVA